tara:strand:+ start:462 stop:1115 length:654 start_codon:yes stop_codon:yes gene_type:complete
MTINVPTSWEAVTLRKYQAITELFKEAEKKGVNLNNKTKELHDYHTECALISTLTDTGMDEVLNLNRNAHTSIMNELRFLQEPIDGKVKNRARVNKTWYHFEKNASKINGGQWVTIMHFLEDEEQIDANLHNLLACFTSRYKWFKPSYDGKIHNEVAEDMLDLPMTTVKPLTDFFLKDWLQSVKNMGVYLEIKGKMLKRKAERQLARSSQDTDGSTP